MYAYRYREHSTATLEHSRNPTSTNHGFHQLADHLDIKYCNTSQNRTLYLFLPHKPEFEDIIESTTLDTFVSCVIGYIIADLVLLEEIGSFGRVARCKQPVMLCQKSRTLQRYSKWLVWVPSDRISPTHIIRRYKKQKYCTLCIWLAIESLYMHMLAMPFRLVVSKEYWWQNRQLAT